MRIHEPNIAPAQALPLFAAHYFSPVLTGMMLGAILITVITCAGGLALGIATMITRDLYQRYLRPRLSDSEGVLVTRITIVVMVVLAVLIGGSRVLKLIISYSFLAFAFRADAMLIPVIVAAIGPRLRLNSAGAGIGALMGGMVTNIVWSLAVSSGGAAVFHRLGRKYHRITARPCRVAADVRQADRGASLQRRFRRNWQRAAPGILGRLNKVENVRCTP